VLTSRPALSKFDKVRLIGRALKDRLIPGGSGPAKAASPTGVKR